MRWSRCIPPASLTVNQEYLVENQEMKTVEPPSLDSTSSPREDRLTSYAHPQTNSLPGWALLPLRLFLGITFTYAGVQKLTDPDYFRPEAAGYIGKQIASFATGSPLSAFLLHVAVPHATLFGACVVSGEVAIGIATLLGLLSRPAAFCGALLNLVFFLSASWRVRPYFYGSDIVFLFCWLTLLLAGPASTGLPALDALLVSRLLQKRAPERGVAGARMVQCFLGGGPSTAPVHPASNQLTEEQDAHHQGRQMAMKRSQASRRNFLWGVLTGSAGVLGLTWLGSAFHVLWSPFDRAISQQGTPSPTPGTSSVTPEPSSVIAHVPDVPRNSTLNFIIEPTGEPGVLVHLKDGKFVAYNALCTHFACVVTYDPRKQLLRCPCHGSEFDAAHAGTVITGPAASPLENVPLSVDKATGTIAQAQ